MTRVSITTIDKGDTAATTDANSTLESWNTSSTGINQVNVREEGLDERMFAAGTIVSGQTAATFLEFKSVVLSNTTYPASPDYQIGPTDFSDANAECIVRLSCQIELGTISASTAQAMVKFQLGYSTDGSTWVMLVETERIYKYHRPTLYAEITAGLPLVVNNTVAHRFTLAANKPTLYFGLFTCETNASVSYGIHDLQFFSQVFLR